MNSHGVYTLRFSALSRHPWDPVLTRRPLRGNACRRLHIICSCLSAPSCIASRNCSYSHSSSSSSSTGSKRSRWVKERSLTSTIRQTLIRKAAQGQEAGAQHDAVCMMLPMSVRCKTCGNFMYKGTKFNAQKEDVEGDSYLGLQIFRFHYSCMNCGTEFTMKTDLKGSDYTLEEGATRNYEPWREVDALRAEALRSRELEEERGNAMKALENRTKDSRREVGIVEVLDEMRSLKARHEGITSEQVLAPLQQASAGAEDRARLCAEAGSDALPPPPPPPAAAAAAARGEATLV